MLWLLISAVLFAWFSVRYAWWRPMAPPTVPRILMYHMVSPHRAGARFNGLRVTPRNFERQLAWLSKNGWSSLTISELLDLPEGERPPRSVVLTFDDGFADNYHRAFPLLKRYGFKATLYLVVDRHGREWSTAKKAHHTGGELMREEKLSDEQVREMLDSGLIELGSHTLSHPNFLNLDVESKRFELSESKRRLEERFGVEVRSFAYPFGLFKEGDDRLVAAMGYASAVTTEAGLNPEPEKNPYLLRRVKISGKDNLLGFVMRMRGGRRGWKK